MHFRIYDKVKSQYVDDTWLLKNDDVIVEIRNHQMYFHKSQDFIVEAWTGYFDTKGRKVYCGDILEMYSFFDFKSKVVWENGAFFMVPIDPEGLKNTMGKDGILNHWTITGNVHGQDFSEK